jgi:hypothetical protein
MTWLQAAQGHASADRARSRVVRHASVVSLPFPDPAIAVSSRAEVFRSRLPSGWPPIELLKYVAHDELQRLEWGLEGRPVTGPWGERPDGRWYVAADETPADLRVAPAA